MNEQMETGQRLLQMWTDFASKMSSAGIKFSPETAPPDAVKSLRSVFLSALSQQTEQFMRSPEFLAMMKQTVDASIAIQRQSAELLTQARHAGQGVARSDMDSVLASLQHLEDRVLQRMDELSARLDQVEGKGRRKPKSRAKRKAGKK